MSYELLDVVPVGNTLGECVLWNDRQAAIWWTDIHEATLYQYHYPTRNLTQYSLPQRLASFGFTEREGTLVCAFESGFALYEPETARLEWLAQPEKHLPNHRFNDGRVDRQGRFWAGTMVENNGESSVLGSLYCLDRGDCKKKTSGIRISNAICWSTDNHFLYFADSTQHQIQRYEFDAQTGDIQNPSLFIQTTPPFEPDGAIVDADNFVWNALWGGGKVVRYSPSGAIDQELHLPVSQPTCIAFGGENRSLLLVTTARVGLTDQQLKEQPFAGHLFIYQTTQQGLVEPLYQF